MRRRRDFGVCFLIPDYEYTDYDLDVINRAVDVIFPGDYEKLEKIYSDEKWTVIYYIQPPILSSDSSWRKFFEKLKKLFEVTRDYDSHFCNEPEAE